MYVCKMYMYIYIYIVDTSIYGIYLYGYIHDAKSWHIIGIYRDMEYDGNLKWHRYF